MAKDKDATVLAIEGREVAVTHPDKPYFSREAKLTKLDVVRYFLSVAEGAVGGIRDRPLVLKRFVDGAEGEPFYQKRAPAQRPGWLRTVTLSFPSGRTAEEVVVDDAAGLAWVSISAASSFTRTRSAPATSIIPTSSASISTRRRASNGTTSAASRWR